MLSKKIISIVLVITILIVPFNTIYANEETSELANDAQLTHTVTFLIGEGEIIFKEIVVEDNQLVSLFNDPEREGYEFDGWFKDSDRTIEWHFLSDTITEDTTIYAGWIEMVHVILISEGIVYDEGDVDVGAVVKKDIITEVFKREGYTLIGLFIDEELNVEWDYDQMRIEEDMTLYMKWESTDTKLSVSFNSKGGSAVDTQAEIEPNTRIQIPEEPIKEGHQFMGWHIDEDATELWDFSNYVKENMTLYAGWEANRYTVIFLSDDDPVEEKYDVEWGSTINPVSVEGLKLGYVFEGWYRDEEYNTKWDFDTDQVKEDLELYAKWLPSETTFSITFDTAGGTIVNDISNHPINTLIPKPENPTLDGHDFEGWYIDGDENKSWNFEIDLVKSNINLIAKWTICTYDIIFMNNGIEELRYKDIEWGQMIAIPQGINNPGYTFEGWYKDSQYNEKWDFNWNSVEEATTLHAKWRKIPTSSGSNYISSKEKIRRRDKKKVSSLIDASDNLEELIDQFELDSLDSYGDNLDNITKNISNQIDTINEIELEKNKTKALDIYIKSIDNVMDIESIEDKEKKKIMKQSIRDVSRAVYDLKAVEALMLHSKVIETAPQSIIDSDLIKQVERSAESILACGSDIEVESLEDIGSVDSDKYNSRIPTDYLKSINDGLSFDGIRDFETIVWIVNTF